MTIPLGDLKTALTTLPLPKSLASKSLKDNSVKLYQLPLSFLKPISSDDWAVLAHDEKAQAKRYIRHDDRVRFISTRAALKRLLATQLGMIPNTIIFDTNAYGKPELPKHVQDRLKQTLEFNISHAGDFALIAISKGFPVGVDIEKRQTVANLAHDIAEHLYSDAEKALRLTNRMPLDVALTWVAKEAVVKSIGLGLYLELTDFSILPNTGVEQADSKSTYPPTTALCVKDAPAACLATEVVEIPINDDYVAALAIAYPPQATCDITGGLNLSKLQTIGLQKMSNLQKVKPHMGRYLAANTAHSTHLYLKESERHADAI